MTMGESGMGGMREMGMPVPHNSIPIWRTAKQAISLRAYNAWVPSALKRLPI
jgi:hypothetical protein